MPTQRKSLTQLAESGTLGRNKGRYAARIAAQSVVIPPIGQVPGHLSPAEKAAWAEIVKSAPAGLLSRPDRIIVELAAKLISRLRAGDSKASELNLLLNILGRIGFSPIDRLKFNLEPPPEPKEKSAWDELDELD